MDFDVESVYVPMEAGDDSTLIIDAHAGTERARLCIKPGATESSNYSVLVTRGREVYDLCENTNCTEGNTVARSENDYFINVTLGSAGANGGDPNATPVPTDAPTPVPTSVPTASPTAVPTVPCFSPDTVLMSTTGFVKAGDVHPGMLIFGERRASKVTAVAEWNDTSVSVCVVPTDFCGEHTIVDPALITADHALRCRHWEAGLWAFCEPHWERKVIDSVVNIQLESYFADTILLADQLVLESWDGAHPGEVCGTSHSQCPLAHGWLLDSTHPHRFKRLTVRTAYKR